MEKETLVKRLIKKLRGELSASESGRWEDQLRASGDLEETKSFEAVWQLAGKYKSAYRPDSRRGLEAMRRRMRMARRRRRQRRIFLASAAAACLALLLGLWWWSARSPGMSDQMTPVVVQSGEVPKTQQLPDGTTILLNRRSRISYDLASDGSLAGAVILQGEAFFEVAPQASGQFVVRTERTEVAVLGTAFNLRAMPAEEATELEVEEGSVAFRARSSGQEVLVRGAQRAVLAGGELQLRDNAPFLASRAWRRPTLNFRETSLKEVVRTLRKYYGIQLELDLEQAGDCAFTSPAFAPDEVEEVVQGMALIYHAELIKKSENHYLLTGGSCDPAQ